MGKEKQKQKLMVKQAALTGQNRKQMQRKQGQGQKQDQMQEQNQEQKQKEKQSQKQKQKQLVEQVAIYSLLLFGAVGGRAAMQGLPSVEPVTFFAFLAGILFGSKVGFMFGAKAMFLSNFLVLGGQGFWTPFQMLGMGIGGALGGLMRRGGITFKKAAFLVIAATLVYEVIMNISWALTFGFYLLPLTFVTALPFAIAHLSSNTVFAAFLPKASRGIEKVNFAEILAKAKTRLGRKKN